MDTLGQGSGVRPIGQRDVASEDVIVRPIVQYQGIHLSFFEQFQKVKPPMFKGDIDGIITQDWNMDVQPILLALGANVVQMQMLATFCLQGEVSKWWDTRWMTTQKFTVLRMSLWRCLMHNIFQRPQGISDNKSSLLWSKGYVSDRV